MKKIIWTKEQVFEESKKYTSIAEFQKKSVSAYTKALKNNWLDDMAWLPRMRSRRWTKEAALEESKKYKTRTEFARKSSGAYDAARYKGWLDEMTWLEYVPNPYIDNMHTVYGYFDHANKVAYIGLTMNTRRRSFQHKHEGPVCRYFGYDNIPDPVYLESNLSAIEAQEKEDYYIKYYKSEGYVLLNKARTGKHVGSLGGAAKKWTKNRVFKESKKYRYLRDFIKGSPTAYDVARCRGWLEDMTWIHRMMHMKWTYDEVLEISKQYTTKAEFKKNEPKAYCVANEKHWMKDFTWLKSVSTLKWTHENVIAEAKKHKNVSSFAKRVPAAYDAARRNGWLAEMTWTYSKKKWTYGSVSEESKKYTLLKDFAEHSSSAYITARRNGWMKDFT